MSDIVKQLEKYLPRGRSHPKDYATIKHTFVKELLAHVRKLEQERDRLASDALIALSSAKIATPEKGFVGEPHLLKWCIEELARERDKEQDNG